MSKKEKRLGPPAQSPPPRRPPPGPSGAILSNCRLKVQPGLQLLLWGGRRDVPTTSRLPGLLGRPRRQSFHDSSCPFWAAEDERQAADRRWFEDHPGAKSLIRPITHSEIIRLRLTGYLPPGWSAAGTIEIIQIRPGVRVRRFADTYMIPPRDGAA